ncbi:MAG: hypothetical protein R3250_12545, partial [Melioribacteraceae bacterium]|nr:hypothetical protein [Melioribacteraceae bacterium]
YTNEEFGFEFKYRGELKEDLYNKDENNYGSKSFNVRDLTIHDNVVFSDFGFYTKEFAKEHKLDTDGPHSSFDFDLKRFNDQKDALNKGLSYNGEQITFIKNRPYHIAGLPCEDSCTLRYTTYFNDIRVSFYIWATYDFHDKYTDHQLFHKEFRKRSDKLIEQMEIKEIK